MSVCKSEAACRSQDKPSEPCLTHAVTPGAARHGNFPNYYQFNLSSERVKILDRLHTSDLIELKHGPMMKLLDIGCNTGDLTIDIFKWFQNAFPDTKMQMTAIDIDKNLIECAKNKNSQFSSQVEFLCTDVMDNAVNLQQYDVILCFSVTLWIHINHGDDGLRKFLSRMCGHCKYLILEAQPWKCYKTAVRRMKRAGEPPFPQFEAIEIRENVTEFIDDFISNNCNFKKVKELGTTGWQRQIILYQNKYHMTCLT